MSWKTFRNQWIRASVFAGSLTCVLTPFHPEQKPSKYRGNVQTIRQTHRLAV